MANPDVKKESDVVTELFTSLLATLEKVDPSACVAQAFEAALVVGGVVPCATLRMNESDPPKDWHAIRNAAVQKTMAHFPGIGFYRPDTSDEPYDDVYGYEVESYVYDLKVLNPDKIVTAINAHYDETKAYNIHDLYGNVWRHDRCEPPRLQAETRAILGTREPQVVGLVQFAADDSIATRERMFNYEDQLNLIARRCSPLLRVIVNVERLPCSRPRRHRSTVQCSAM